MEFLAYAGSVILSVLQISLCKIGGNKSDRDIFNVNKSVGATTMFIIMGIVFSISLHFPTIIYSLLYGIFLMVSMWAGLTALAIGPLAITSMIVSFALIIPCIFGIAVLNERISVFGIIGILLLICSLVFVNIKKRSNGKMNIKWFIFTITNMISDGCASVVKKLHQKAYPGKYMIEFMLFSMTFVAICFIIIMLLKHKPKNARELVDVKGILSGIANGGSCFISLYLASFVNLTVMSPIIAVLTTSASLLTGRVLFNEKLTSTQIIGFILGVMSIVLLKI